MTSPQSHRISTVPPETASQPAVSVTLWANRWPKGCCRHGVHGSPLCVSPAPPLPLSLLSPPGMLAALADAGPAGVLLPSCRHDEQPPLAEQITSTHTGQGAPCIPSIRPRSGRRADTPSCLLSATNVFLPKVNRKSDSQCLTSVGLVLPGASQAPVPAPASFFPPPLKSPSCLSMGTLRVLELQTPQVTRAPNL